MNSQQILSPLIQQLELLQQVLNTSPYISREDRLGIEKEIHDLSQKLTSGEINLQEGEKNLAPLMKKLASCEINTLISKIRQLNPNSPRLVSLRAIGNDLQADLITPDAARQKIQELMQG